jgi:enoyl-CoA hydratase/carnithine racemase
MTNPIDLSSVSLSIEGGIAQIALRRSGRRNALDTAAWQLLGRACNEISANQTIRAVVLVGSGAHFCAGADIHELSANIHDVDWMQRNQSAIAEALDAYAALPVPTICAVRGACFGGGMALAVSSDFCVAHASARFAITPAKLGLSYRLIDCLRVVEAVGAKRARELLLAARELSASDALLWGLVNSVVDDLDTELQEQTQKLVRLSGISQRAIKTNLLKIREGATRDDETTRCAFRDAFTSVDFEEGAAAFLEKRVPHFR